jgi:hypothetical protein
MSTTLRAGALGLALAGIAIAQDRPGAAGAAARADAAGKADAQPPVDVPVRAVVLYSSGVGYFEHAGSVKGDATTELRFKTAQINDVLKSLVLEDAGGGRIGTVSYPSEEPLERTLKSFQVDITANPSLAQLLNQLRGAQVWVTGNVGAHEGTILGVERKEVVPPNAQVAVERWVVNLFTAGSVVPIPLDEIQRFEIRDPELRTELEKALAALAQSRDQDKKPVTIRFEGSGERPVRIGYVVETPIWKTSYRLLMPEDPKAKPKLQGWAIVENQTDNDWNDVALSLVSGRPISFVQNLYTPLYIPRPVVEPELYASLGPQTYGAGVAKKDGDPDRFAGRDKARRRAAVTTGEDAEGLYDEDLARKMKPALSVLAPGAATAGSTAARPMDPTAGVRSVAQAGKMGELFKYTVFGVTLPRQRSAMLPIVTDDLDVERLSIYNAAVLPRNPLNGARVKNTTGKHLLQGPVTVLDGNAYAGDARIDDIPPGQERLVSYAIDLKVLVDSTTGKQDSTLVTGKIVQGVLRLTRRHVATRDYLIDNKDEKEKTVIVEHPIRHGWKLVDTPAPVETTDALYRFKGAVGAGKTSKLTVKEELVSDDTLAILDADLGQLQFYSRAGEIPKEVREALERAIRMKAAMVETQRQIEERQKELAAITEEQQRIRSNMNTVGANTPYYQRLLTKLNEQETKIEKTQTEMDALRQQVEQQRKGLEEYLQGLNLG